MAALSASAHQAIVPKPKPKPELELEPEPEPEPDDSATTRAELELLRPSARKKRAVAAGVTEAEFDEIDDSEDPAEALISAILAHDQRLSQRRNLDAPFAASLRVKTGLGIRTSSRTGTLSKEPPPLTKSPSPRRGSRRKTPSRTATPTPGDRALIPSPHAPTLTVQWEQICRRAQLSAARDRACGFELVASTLTLSSVPLFLARVLI